MSTGATFAGPTRRRLCALCALCLLCALRVFALPPARAMYIDALAREQAIRAAMTAADASPGVLEDLRAVRALRSNGS